MGFSAKDVRISSFSFIYAAIFMQCFKWLSAELGLVIAFDFIQIDLEKDDSITSLPPSPPLECNRIPDSTLVSNNSWRRTNLN